MEQSEDKILDPREKIYRNALRLAEGGLFSEAAAEFDRVSDYRDAAQKKIDCVEKLDASYKDKVYAEADKAAGNANVKSQQKAIRIFQSISGWRDADERIEKANRRIEEILIKERADRKEAQRLAEIDRQKRLKRKKRIRRTVLIASLSAVLLLTGAFLFQKFAVPALKYRKAAALIEAGEQDDAYRILHGLNYRDSSELVYQLAKDRLKDAEIGSTVLFGSYMQGHNTSSKKDVIEWIVLDRRGSKLLLISKYALDCLPYQRYDKKSATATWSTSLLREWLNDTFLTEAFDEGELRMLVRTSVKADHLTGYASTESRDTADKVFLLSVLEAKRYFASDEARQCTATQFAIDYGAYQSSVGRTCIWWLRTTVEPSGAFAVDDSDDMPTRAVCVGTSGQIIEAGHKVRSRQYTVRPAIWVDTDPPEMLPITK